MSFMKKLSQLAGMAVLASLVSVLTTIQFLWLLFKPRISVNRHKVSTPVGVLIATNHVVSFDEDQRALRLWKQNNPDSVPVILRWEDAVKLDETIQQLDTAAELYYRAATLLSEREGVPSFLNEAQQFVDKIGYVPGTLHEGETN
jgi:hypothetical protein